MPETPKPAAAPDPAIAPCPLTCGEIEIVVVGDDERPLADVPLELGDPRSPRVLLGKTDADGRCVFRGVPAGRYRFRPTGIDGSFWSILGSRERPAPAGTSPAAKWQDKVEPKPLELACTGSEELDVLSRQLGVPRDLLHDAATKQPLAHDPKKGTKVVVPPPLPRYEQVETDHRYVVHRRGLPLSMHLHLFDAFHRPYANRPYLLKVSLADGSAAPSREGRTDDQGRVVERLPTQAAQGELVLDRGSGPPRRLKLRFGALSHEVDGWQQRLEHLGFPCGGERGSVGNKTRAALEAFQLASGLPVSGAFDDITCSALLALHGS